jgi:hypothetical protein
MLNIEEVKKEYYRIEELLNKEALSQSIYNANCQLGYSAYLIKKELGLTYNGMKKIIGAKAASNANHKGGIKKSKKIFCERTKTKINETACVIDCNDICLTCDSRQEGNVRAINTTTPEEDRELNYTSSFGNSGALAAAEGLYSN